ncbi:MAG: hypothetical protein V1877_00090 [Candidatus Tagabacteria bacterium]
MATHNTGHGEVSDSVLITNSIRKAVKTARGIENLEYEFYSTEIGVGIYSLKPERVYHKEAFKWLPGQTPPPTVIFYRRHHILHMGASHYEDGKCWKEEWFDKKLENQCKKIK